MCETVGYIVADHDWLPLWMDDRVSTKKAARGVLYIGSPTATVFKSRREAQEAIDRTLKYQRDNGLRWGEPYRIIRLVTPKPETTP